MFVYGDVVILKIGRHWPWKTVIVSSHLRMSVRPKLLYRMALVSFQLFRKNLGNLREFFGQMVYHPPWQKFARTPMVQLIQIISTWCYNWNSLKIWYITKTMIPCSLQSIATLQNTILIARYVQEKYSGDLSCASANKKMSH